jgi:predicted O-methyltransferase YrrM
MALEFHAEKSIANKVLKEMKGDSIISKDAKVNFKANNNLRKEVTVKDIDFLQYLADIEEEEVVDSALKWLKNKNLIDGNSSYDKVKFEKLRKEIKTKFDVPATAVTPAMERILYALSTIKKPQSFIAIGIYCGNTLVWSAGSSCGKGKVYDSGKIYGIDINKKSIKLAKDNFSKLKNTKHIKLIAEDGLKFIDQTNETFDYIYLDADNKEVGKSLYFDLLKKLYPKIRKGGWLLAHDTNCPWFNFHEQLEDYFKFVRDKKNFQESVSFNVDLYGLELSIK